MLTRREFLKVGAGGALVLASARVVRAQASRERDRRAGEQVFDGEAREVLAAITPILLAGALPMQQSERSTRIAATLAGVETAIAGLPRHAQEDLRDLFALLGFAPTRWLLTGVGQRWRDTPPEAIATFLQRWRTSTWTLKEQAYHALHALVFAAFYADPRSWPAIGYPGPPRLD